MPAAPNRRPPGRFLHTVSSCPAISSLVEEDSSSIDEGDIRPASEGSDHDMVMGITEHHEPAAPCSRPPRPPGRFMVEEKGTTSMSTGEEVLPTSTGNVMDDPKMLMVIKEHKMPAVPCSRPPGRFIHSISSCPSISSLVEQDNMQNVSPYLVPQCDLVAQNRGRQQADNNYIRA